MHENIIRTRDPGSNHAMTAIRTHAKAANPHDATVVEKDGSVEQANAQQTYTIPAEVIEFMKLQEGKIEKLQNKVEELASKFQSYRALVKLGQGDYRRSGL